MTRSALVLAVIRDQGEATSWDIAAALQLPLKLATAHVAKLRQQGRVEIARVLVHPGDRRGPAEKAYREVRGE